MHLFFVVLRLSSPSDLTVVLRLKTKQKKTVGFVAVAFGVVFRCGSDVVLFWLTRGCVLVEQPFRFDVWFHKVFVVILLSVVFCWFRLAVCGFILVCVVAMVSAAFNEAVARLFFDFGKAETVAHWLSSSLLRGFFRGGPSDVQRCNDTNGSAILEGSFRMSLFSSSPLGKMMSNLAIEVLSLCAICKRMLEIVSSASNLTHTLSSPLKAWSLSRMWSSLSTNVACRIKFAGVV